MHNLLLFFQRYYHFFLFLLLEIFALYFLFQFNNYHNAAFFNSANKVSGVLYSYQEQVVNYFNLKQVNESLLEENARLKSKLAESFYIDSATRVEVVDTAFKQQYEYVTAKVVKNSVNSQKNYFTINKGSKHGIKPKMGVISNEGVAGIIDRVSEHFSIAISVLNTKEFRITPKVEGNEYFGSFLWDGKNPRYGILEEINKHVEIARGQKVVTSGFSSVFPQNIPIGTIQDFSLEPGKNSYKIRVKLSTSFENLSTVYVINNLMKEELEDLEASKKNIKN